MGDKTGIQWTDATWNPVRGCTRVSEGCRNCYAEKVATRFSGPGAPYEGLVTARGRWNGTINLVPDKLDQPLRWQKPRRVFVNSMSDLFHEGVSFEYIAAVFGVMAASPRHTFQVLTKRPERAKAFFEWLGGARAHQADSCIMRAVADKGPLSDLGRKRILSVYGHICRWPLPNVWLGVSIEDQATANARIPLLLQLLAAVLWVSYEPALGPVIFPDVPGLNRAGTSDPGLDWIVVGGESGPGARPFNVEWARRVIRDCAVPGVPVFVKQLGARPFDSVVRTWGPDPENRALGTIWDRKGGDWDEWPEDLRVREWPRVAQ